VSLSGGSPGKVQVTGEVADSEPWIRTAGVAVGLMLDVRVVRRFLKEVCVPPERGPASRVLQADVDWALCSSRRRAARGGPGDWTYVSCLDSGGFITIEAVAELA
jgi:hypothetical protein